MYCIDDYDYRLPSGLIAQEPEKARDHSRLLGLDRRTGDITHHLFADIERLLRPGDLLVVNDTRVIPGRLVGTKETGGRIEVLMLDYPTGAARGKAPSSCMYKASRPPRSGSRITFSDQLTARVVDAAGGRCTLAFEYEGTFDDILEKTGDIPLPPYIRRDAGQAPCDDASVYQTVYAARRGAVAAPTAGLHFTAELLDRLEDRGISRTAVTLHVGYGTFSPVRVTDIRDHQIHSEAFTVSEETADAVNRARGEGRRVIAVGTTSVRTLEYAWGTDGRVHPGDGQCDLFIYPGYRFRCIDGMITNFHLPRSTLMMLVSAFAGRNPIMAAYREAIEREYRFFSYGDAMLIV